MTTTFDHTEIPMHGKPAVVARLFGWLSLTIMGAFLLNNILVVYAGFPGVKTLGSDSAAWVHVAVYGVAVVIAIRARGRRAAAGRQSVGGAEARRVPHGGWRRRIFQ